MIVQLVVSLYTFSAEHFSSACRLFSFKERVCLWSCSPRQAKLDEQVSAVVPGWRNRQTPLGVQFIIAVTDFEAGTGGTQVRTAFLLQLHATSALT